MKTHATMLEVEGNRGGTSPPSKESKKKKSLLDGTLQERECGVVQLPPWSEASLLAVIRELNQPYERQNDRFDV